MSNLNKVFVPFDLAAAEKMADWRERLVWPVSHEERYNVLKGQSKGLIKYIGGIDDDSIRDILLLGTPPILGAVRFLTDTATTVRNEKLSGIELVGNLPELAFLRGKTGAEEVPLSPKAFYGAPDKIWLRRLVRTASWTPWWRLGQTFATPTATAISHNSLLREAARESNERLVFHHAEDWLAKARAQDLDNGFNEDVAALAESLADVLVTCSGLNDSWGSCLRALVLPLAQDSLQQASRDMDAMLRMDDLPMTVWSGSGGYYPARSLSLAVMRRGGTVKGFEHGGALGFLEDNLTVGEFASVTEYVLCTREKANLPSLKKIIESCSIGPHRPIKISGHHGDPSFRFSLTRRKPGTQRPKVVYITTILIGSRQIYPPLLPDVVHLDWQLRVAEHLSRLHIDLNCRPHPEGLYPGGCHPLADIAPLSNDPLRQVMEEADLFVHDYSRSTAFWECLCTDKPVVFLSPNHDTFAPEVQALIEDRCRFVEVEFDENNMPQFDGELLTQAVLDDSKPVDSSAIRRILAGAG